jgi:chemotaxis protein histidine kinase CheA
VKAAGLEDSNLLRFSGEKLVKQEAARSGILAVAEFQGFGRRTVPNEYRKLVKDVLIQLIRNSFAHGFETPDLRLQKGKTEVGRISLSLEWAEDSFTIRYADDGKGLDAGAIRRKAKSIPEIASQVDAMGSGELAKLIFRPGFSTSSVTDMGSGRGVGMSLVKSRITDAGGKLAVKSAAGRSLEFAFTLPLGLSERAVS